MSGVHAAAAKLGTPRSLETASPARKKIRSQPPDVIVSVGSGDSKQDFECYSVMLSFASEYLDTMLSSSMKEGALHKIEFPDKVPEEWILFYDFISPQKMRRAEINNENVLTLVPWFHEFQMLEYVYECDAYLANNYFSEVKESFWGKGRPEYEREQRNDKFGEILCVLQLTHMYDLPSAKDAMEKKISDLLDMSPYTEDLFDFPVVKSLLHLVLPLELYGETGLRTKEGESKHLWPQFKKILSPHIPRLSQEIIDDNVSFPHLFYAYMQIKLEKDRSQVERGKKKCRSRSSIHPMVHLLHYDLRTYRKRHGSGHHQYND